MNTGPAVVISMVAGYLLGSIPVAVLVGHRRRVDLRAAGDRNPGYWNAKEQLGRRAAVPVFVGDALKGSLAAAIGLWLGGPWWVGYLAVGAAMVGHAWPVFAGFKGGRSVLTFVGGLLVLAPLPAAIAVGICVVVALATHSFAYGARAGVFAFPVVQLVLEGPYRCAATGGLMCIIGLRFLQAHRTSARANGAPGAVPPA